MRCAWSAESTQACVQLEINNSTRAYADGKGTGLALWFVSGWLPRTAQWHLSSQPRISSKYRKGLVFVCVNWKHCRKNLSRTPQTCPTKARVVLARTRRSLRPHARPQAEKPSDGMGEDSSMSAWSLEGRMRLPNTLAPAFCV